MKRFASICVALLLVSLLVAMTFEAAAQVVNIKRVAKVVPTSGLGVIGKKEKAFFVADTAGSGSTIVSSFSWSLTAPSGSAANLDSTMKIGTSFTADTNGYFYVHLTAGGLTVHDTIFVSNYIGVPADIGTACLCHGGLFDAVAMKAKWAGTAHAKIYSEGIRGKLEVDPATGHGVYKPSCAKCHTTGYNATSNNGNFGYATTVTGWDTTWIKMPAATLRPDGDYNISDTSIYHQFVTNSKWSSVVPVATIGCETCHGPLADHQSFAFGDKHYSKAVTWDAGVCNQCHNASSHHNIGARWAASAHGILETGKDTKRTSCFPCHSGSAFGKWMGNKAQPGWDANVDGGVKISCQACHDPHDATNPKQLRTMSVDSLKNGYKPTMGGLGAICMNCHQARSNVAAKVTTNASKYYGFGAHYGPHGNPQTDMYFGTNGYQFGDNLFTGVSTHATILDDACATCHMQDRGGLPNHEFGMDDTTGGFKPWTVCQPCHGMVGGYDDIRASYDYDGNGVIEGVQTEVQGLLTKLKAILPKNPSGEPLDDMYTPADTATILAGGQPLVGKIWDYYLVKNDRSMGVHNAKYAVSILQKALGLYPLDVKKMGLEVPKDFALNQNYPNPFNPTTNITFSLPKDELVRLEVYDMLGRLVKTLVNSTVSAGNFSITWDGKDQDGAKVSSGMYLYRLQAGSFSTVKKMLMLK
jgi:hypothetical protein